MKTNHKIERKEPISAMETFISLWGGLFRFLRKLKIIYRFVVAVYVVFMCYHEYVCQIFSWSEQESEEEEKGKKNKKRKFKKVDYIEGRWNRRENHRLKSVAKNIFIECK